MIRAPEAPSGLPSPAPCADTDVRPMPASPTLNAPPSRATRRVLLVNTNEYDQPYPVYPLGLAYVKGALGAAGYPCEIWDAHAPRGTLEEAIARFEPAYVALSMRNLDNVQFHNPNSFVAGLLAWCIASHLVDMAKEITHRETQEKQINRQDAKRRV